MNGVYSELGVHYLGCILYGVEVHYRVVAIFGTVGIIFRIW